MTLVKTQPVDGLVAGFAVAGGNITVENSTTPTIRPGGELGLGFGPLRIVPFAGTTVRIDELSFSALDESILPFLNAASGVTTETTAVGAGAALVAASAPDEDVALRRRDALIAAGTVATAGLAASGTAAADDDDNDEDDDDDDSDAQTRHVAEFELTENPRGIGIRIDDVTENYLPHGETYYVKLDGSVVDSIETGNGEMLTIGPTKTGSVRVVSESEVSLVQRILNQIQGGDEINYTFNRDEPVSEFSRGEEIVITDQELVIEAIQSAGTDETVIEIGDENIPHTDDRSSQRGNWYLRDEAALVYEAGLDSPDSENIELTINAGFVDSQLARFR